MRFLLVTLVVLRLAHGVRGDPATEVSHTSPRLKHASPFPCQLSRQDAAPVVSTKPRNAAILSATPDRVAARNTPQANRRLQDSKAIQQDSCRLNTVSGVASFYGECHRGKLTASGEPFSPSALTCASWFYPLGTRLLITSGGRQVIVTVNDRGPAKRLVAQGRIIDLSEAAFSKLCNTNKGLTQVTITKR